MPNGERASRMLMRIRNGLDANPDPGPWITAARTLGERLIISENPFHYLAEIFTECLFLSESGADPELDRIRDEMDDIERAHGLREDESFHLDDAPDDWLQHLTRHSRRA